MKKIALSSKVLPDVKNLFLKEASKKGITMSEYVELLVCRELGINQSKLNHDEGHFKGVYKDLKSSDEINPSSIINFMESDPDGFPHKLGRLLFTSGNFSDALDKLLDEHPDYRISVLKVP